MKTVTNVSEPESSLGCMGYSVLQEKWDGRIERMTLLFLRDHTGWAHRALILPAAEVRGAF